MASDWMIMMSSEGWVKHSETRNAMAKPAGDIRDVLPQIDQEVADLAQHITDEHPDLNWRIERNQKGIYRIWVFTGQEGA